MLRKSCLIVSFILSGSVVFAQTSSTKTFVAPTTESTGMTQRENAAPTSMSLTAEVILAKSVENRQPSEEVTTVSADTEKIWGWSRIQGAQEPTTISHVWSLNGKELVTVTLDVKSSSYRTWSNVPLNGQTGTWQLQVKDASGNVLGSKSVEVTAAAPAAPQVQ